MRGRLAENPWAQVGADAIAWELEKLGVVPPPRAHDRADLARAGLVERRRRERPKSKRLPYPAPRAEAVGDVVQVDLVGPRHLDGGLPFIALNHIDVVPHAAAIEIVPDRARGDVTAALIAALGAPRRAPAAPVRQRQPFQLARPASARSSRICLHQGATPVFIPPGEPWRNGVFEHFNDTFDKRFFRHERFSDREQLAERALAFEGFHNANHRYRATGRRRRTRPRRRRAAPAATARASCPAAGRRTGRIEFIRFIRSDRKLRLLGRAIAMPEAHAYQYVTATLDLAIPAGEGNLLVTDTDGELVLRGNVPRPGR